MKNILSITIVIALILPIGMLEPETKETDIRIDFSNTDKEMNEEQISDLELKGDFFTENLGQKSEGAGLFYAQGYPLSVGFGPGWAAYNLINQDNTSDIGGVLFRTYFVDCNPVEPIGIDSLPHKNNYFIGNDPYKWVTGASNFREIWYNDLWDGIDLRYYFKDGDLKYDFVVHPSADPNQILIEIDGHSYFVNDQNGITIHLPGDLRINEKYLVSYYYGKPNSVVHSNFIKIDNNKFSFKIGDYNNNKILIIDPLVYSTYIGGIEQEYSPFLSIDNAGNPIICRQTSSTDFPVTSGSYQTSNNGLADIFLMKMRQDGSSPIFSTYIGGIDIDRCENIKLDAQNDIFLIGSTKSTDFPTTSGSFEGNYQGGYHDVYCLKLKSDGTGLIFSTFLGGNGQDVCSDISITQSGDLIVNGRTDSTDFPTTSGAFREQNKGDRDAFVLKLKGDGTGLVFSTYIGGTGNDGPSNFLLDDQENIFLVGWTWSDDFPTTPGAFDRTAGGIYDLYICKVKNDGSSLLFSTYISGNGYDGGGTVGSKVLFDLDNNYNVILCCDTTSNDFPNTNGSYDQTFNGGGRDLAVLKLKSDGSDVHFSTFIGGSGDEFPDDIILDEDGSIIISGVTKSTDFPTISGSYDETYNGNSDVFILKLKNDGSDLIFSTFIGGSNEEAYSLFRMNLCFDNEKNIIAFGTTNSNDFPTISGSYDETYNGGLWDCFVTKLLSDGSILLYSTFIGGNHNDGNADLIQDNLGNLILTGVTASPDFPITSGAFDSTYNGDYDIFLIYLNVGGSIEPLEVYSIKVYSDPDFTTEIDAAEINCRVYIEIQGLDGNETKIGTSYVSININETPYRSITISLEETGLNTGVYRGDFLLSTNTHSQQKKIKTELGETVTIMSLRNRTKTTSLLVWAPVAIRPRETSIVIDEDTEIEIPFTEFGYNEISNWRMDTEADWLQWNDEDHILIGSPDNSDVGVTAASINVTDGIDHFDEVIVEITVNNTPPCILTENILSVNQSAHYYLDYDCDDEGQGDTRWSMEQYIDWLDFNEETGILEGIPTQDDVGTYPITISVDDGNRGINQTQFNLEVIDINEPPDIVTEPTLSVKQNSPYYIDFMAYDIDGDIVERWMLNTDAKWLSIDVLTGELSGTPTNDDVGMYFVNVTTEDPGGLMDWINYTLEVIDVNDAPSWSTIPLDTQINQGKEYTFTAKALDVDIGDSISYSISSQPDSDITIGETTGEIFWVGSLKRLIPNPNYVLNVEVSASDGKESITHGFTIIVIPNPSPTSTILGPDDGKRVISEGILLEWEGEDDGEEPLKYDLYLGTSRTDVSMLDGNVLWMVDLEETSIHTGMLERGKTYYWTPIPKDIFSSGICIDDVFSFTVNIPPSIQDFNIPEAKVREEFRLNLMGSDLNGDDVEFTIEEGPSNMELFNGMITWIPGASQVGIHTVNVSLSDGYESVYKEFDVTVKEEEIASDPDDKGSPIAIIIIIIIVILILAGAGVGLFLYMKKKGEEEPIEESADENPPKNTGPPEEEKQAYNQLYGPP